MEIPEELLRNIVHEVVHELGSEADPALLRKVVKEVLRRLDSNKARTSSPMGLQPTKSLPY